MAPSSSFVAIVGFIVGSSKLGAERGCYAVPPTLVIAVVADARCAEVRQSGDNPALGWSSKLLTRHREMGSTLRHAGNAYNIMLR